VPPAWRAEAWAALGLSGSFEELEADYWQTFHLGAPAPPVPLQLHAALGRDGGHVREDWTRVFQFLGLRWDGPTLAPDHLGAACEALATAVENDDRVLARELCSRYLNPWCEVAHARLAGNGGVLAEIPAFFAADLDRLGS
jgi:nitrate reductase assembly molybdenum cofactor insertion protein NarJ